MCKCHGYAPAKPQLFILVLALQSQYSLCPGYLLSGRGYNTYKQQHLEAGKVRGVMMQENYSHG